MRHRLLQNMSYRPPVEKCWYLLSKAQKPHFLSHNPHHPLSLAIFIPPPPCSIFPNLCSSTSSLSLSLLSLSSCQSHCPPTCLPALVQPPLSASFNVFCPYKERAQADCTNRVSTAGVLQGHGARMVCMCV